MKDVICNALTERKIERKKEMASEEVRTYTKSFYIPFMESIIKGVLLLFTCLNAHTHTLTHVYIIYTNTIYTCTSFIQSTYICNKAIKMWL